MSAQFDGHVAALVLKLDRQRLTSLPAGYAVMALDSIADAKAIREAINTFYMCSHVANFRAEFELVTEIPTWAEMQEWLRERRCDSYANLTATAKRAIVLKTADRYQRCLAKVMASECKEYFESLQTANSMVKLVGSCSRVYYRDFRANIRSLVGVRWDPYSSTALDITLEDAIDGQDNWCFRCALIFVGRPGMGKTTLVRAIAQELTDRVGKDSFAESTSLDPFGLLTKLGGCARLGAIAVSDFDMMTLMNEKMSDADAVGLFNVEDGASYKCRYHPAQFEKNVPRLFAVNPTVNANTLATEWGGWFIEQRLPILDCLVRRDLAGIATYGDVHKALLRRVIIFTVDTPLFNLVLGHAPQDDDLLALGALGRANAYKL
jgi:hypothetical protein